MIDRRIEEYGDMDIRFDNYDVKGVRFMRRYFTDKWLEIMI